MSFRSFSGRGRVPLFYEKINFSRMSFSHSKKWWLVKKLVQSEIVVLIKGKLKVQITTMFLVPQKWIERIQMSPKNLRLAAILISIYEIVSAVQWIIEILFI